MTKPIKPPGRPPKPPDETIPVPPIVLPPEPVEPPVVPIGSAPWGERIKKAEVVWWHNFGKQEELDYHLDLSHAAVSRSATSPGGYVLNKSTTFGVHDYRLNPYIVSGQPTSSGNAMEIRNLGGRLAKPLDATAMQMELTDASRWPDPEDDVNRFYWVALHATGTQTNPIAAGTPSGAKGAKECVVIRRVTGNVVYLAGRGCSYSESAGTGGIVAKSFLAGTVVGRDVHGGWGRVFSALDAASSGTGAADPAANGTLPRRAKAPRAMFSEGYYADPFYHRHSEFAGKSFDGDDFFIQFRCQIDPARSDPDVLGGKLFFIDPHAGGGQQQIVGAGPHFDDATCGVFGDFGGERYSPDTLFQPITAPDGSIISNFPSCKVGSKKDCYEWPVGLWFTTIIHVRPGYSMDVACPTPKAGDDTADALTVDTSYFKPTNGVESDGVRRMRFETTLPPLFKYLPAEFNRHSLGYFTNGGWSYDWPTAFGTNQFAGGKALCESCEIADYSGTKRMRWSFVQRGITAFVTTVPSDGHKMQLDVIDRNKAFPEHYRKHEIDLWVKPDGGEVVQVYGLAKYMIVFGSGYNKYHANPPAYNEFKPTGYANVWDNLAPHPTCTWYRFGDILFTKAMPPWPSEF